MGQLGGYFTSCSAVAGSLIGLLFVAITLRYEQILGLGAKARDRGMAKGAFVALADALAVSLLAQLPPDDVGWPVAIVAIASALSTTQTQIGLAGRRGLLSSVYIAATVVFGVQMVLGIVLASHPHRSGTIDALAGILLVDLAVALVRSWMLLQPDVMDSSPDAKPAGTTSPGGSAQPSDRE
jgi:hypothetical protein